MSSLHLTLALALVAPALAPAAVAASELQISPQGILQAPDPLLRESPRGSLQLRVVPLQGDLHRLQSGLRIHDVLGGARTLPRVRGDGFLPSDVGRIVAIEAGEANTVATRLAVLDLAGRELRVQRVAPLSGAVLSSEGTHLAYRSAGALFVLDLRSLEERRHPNLSPFAAGPGGGLFGLRDGELVLREAGGAERTFAAPGGVRRVAFAGSRALVLTPAELLALDPRNGLWRTLYAAAPGTELRDLRSTPGGLYVGARKVQGATARGLLLRLGARGATAAATSHGPIANRPPRTPTLVQPPPPQALRWPIDPSAQHPIGNTYGEYQNYGGSPYLHPGIDVLGADHQPVYAVADGVVKALLTTSAQYHWRVAIASEAGAGTSDGYLYAHLDFPSIAVNVGDSVVEGQYLGDLVPWPVSGFTHVHFARIEDTGAQWFGDWLCTDNPHLDLEHQSEGDVPFFLPALGSDLLAFCYDETSVYQSPLALTGRVDIIARIGDRVAASWVCTAQELRYSIFPVGTPGAPVVDDKLAAFFDMQLDTYQNGPVDPFLVGLLYKDDATCNTQGDYGSREFFHILTNSDGDQVYEPTDPNEAWDTTVLSDGDYVIEVTATDVAGNHSSASMTVTTSNGNP